MTAINQAEELMGIAQRIRDRQLAQDVSDEKWVGKHRDLGSSKTYKNILAGNMEGYSTERWLLAYRAALNQVEAEAKASQDRDPIYDDLSTVTRLRVAVIDAMNAKGNDRLIIVQGPSGAGKTESLHIVGGKFGRRVVLVEADETWKNENAFLCGLLLAMGESIPASGSERMLRLIDALNRSRVMIVIDEAHHLGPRQLNLIKSIINRSPGEVVLAALDTLWNKLETSAYAESRQLIHNRLLERIQITEPDREDIEKILARRLGLEKAEAVKASEMVHAAAKIKGSLKFATRVCRRALIDSGGDTPSIQDVAKAISMVSVNMGVRA